MTPPLRLAQNDPAGDLEVDELFRQFCRDGDPAALGKVFAAAAPWRLAGAMRLPKPQRRGPAIRQRRACRQSHRRGARQRRISTWKCAAPSTPHRCPVSSCGSTAMMASGSASSRTIAAARWRLHASSSARPAVSCTSRDRSRGEVASIECTDARGYRGSASSQTTLETVQVVMQPTAR
jgi:hypothetical protein